LQSVELTIDGVRVEVESGSTILQAARRAGIRIPTLCDHPALEPVGACRLCLVEVEGNPKLLTACTTPVTPGMVVHTRTQRVLEARRFVVELLLIRHPLDCFSCPSNGKCELQDVAYELGVERSSFADPGDVERSRPLEDRNPFYVRDMNKCILCGRCVRACDSLAQYHAIDFQNRGIRTSVEPPVGTTIENSDCVFCGQCVQLCPVGALYEKPSVGQGRPWELDKVKTVCPYCGVGCELYINVNRKTGRIANVTTDHLSPSALNRGRSCVKGRFAWQFVHSPDRLTKPLIKEDGRFREASWDEALRLVASRLGQVAEEFGPDAIGFLASARCTNEDNYLLQKFARVVVGTNNVDHCARLCHAPSVVGLREVLGSGAMTNDYESIKSCDVIFLIGSNVTETHPVIGSFLKERKRQGAKLIVCDPRRIEMANYADLFLQHKNGTDVALLNGIMHVIIRDGLQNDAFIRERTENFEALKELVSSYTPQRVSEITGVAPELIERAAHLYARGPNSAIFYTMGITQHSQGTDNVRAIANLALLCGMIGRPGTGVNPLRGQNNVQGACDVGALPSFLPGYQNPMDQAARERFAKVWGKELPTGSGLTVTEMMDAALGGTIRAMFIMGENPMVSDPDIAHVREALEKLDFLVVQDIFLTETAQLAHVVLPAASWAEKDGTFTNTTRTVQRVRKAVNPPGEARPDWQIIADLARLMGFDWNYSSAEEIFEEIRKVLPAYAGITYSRIEEKGIPWPCPSEDHPGTPTLHVERFPREGGRARFSPCHWRAPHEWPDEEYPFLASTGRILYHYHTGSMSRRSAPGEFIREMFVEVNPEDALRLGISDGDMVRVSSRRGSIECKALVTDRVAPGSVFLPFHFSEAAANQLTSSKERCPASKMPPLKVNAVRIEKL